MSVEEHGKQRRQMVGHRRNQTVTLLVHRIVESLNKILAVEVVGDWWSPWLTRVDEFAG